MDRPSFKPIFDKKSDFCEISVADPVKSFVPGQALDLKELVRRFENGQRLNVHNNFAPGSNFDPISDEDSLARIKSESMDTDDFPPTDVHDIVDVELLYNMHEDHKRDFSARMKKKKEEAQQAKLKQAQQDSPLNVKNPGTDSE